MIEAPSPAPASTNTVDAVALELAHAVGGDRDPVLGGLDLLGHADGADRWRAWPSSVLRRRRRRTGAVRRRDLVHLGHEGLPELRQRRARRRRRRPHHRRSSTRRRARCTPRRRCPARPTSTRPWRPPPRPSRPGGTRTPSERSLALFRIADAVEARADELVALESENTGKPIALDRERGDPADGRPDPLLRRRGPHARGPSAGEYMAGMTSIDPARAGRRRAPRSRPWNYPMMMAVWKFAPAIAAGNTVVLKPSRHHAGHHGAAGRDRGRVPAAGRLQRDLRRPRHRPGDGRARRPGDGVDHRLGAGRHGGGQGGGRRRSSGSTSSSAARRRSSCSTTPTSRPRPRRIADRRLLQRRAGLHGGHPGARRARRLRRLRRRARPSRPRAPTTGAPDDRGRAVRPGQQRQPARAGDRLRRARARPRHGRRRRRTARATRATSSSRPSSPTCARTTR